MYTQMLNGTARKFGAANQVPQLSHSSPQTTTQQHSLGQTAYWKTQTQQAPNCGPKIGPAQKQGYVDKYLTYENKKIIRCHLK